jgi:hypothetical protein
MDRRQLRIAPAEEFHSKISDSDGVLITRRECPSKLRVITRRRISAHSYVGPAISVLAARIGIGYEPLFSS